jgi:hypothetical protein
MTAPKRKIRKISKTNPKKKPPKASKPLTEEEDDSYTKQFYKTLDLGFKSDNIQNFSHLNKIHPGREDLDEMFDDTLDNFLRKGPFERDQISFFKYGAFFRSPTRLPQSVLKDIKDLLMGTKATLTLISEPKSDALLVRFGNDSKAVDADRVSQVLKGRQSEIEAIYDLLSEYGDVYWGLEFETAEEFYA